MKDGSLHDALFTHKDSKLIYLSHEPVGTDHSDPRGEQLGHGTKLLARLRKGEVKRTDMDPFHSLLYKQNFTTTGEGWKRMLNLEKTYIWYVVFAHASHFNMHFVVVSTRTILLTLNITTLEYART